MITPPEDLPILPFSLSPGSTDSADTTSGGELEPWLVVLGEAPETSIALWRLAENDSQAIAIFSTSELAQSYRAESCEEPCEVLQFDQSSFLQIMIESFKAGIEFAALDPKPKAARQIFKLKDVLQAAKRQLGSREG